MSESSKTAIYVCYHQGKVDLDSDIFKPLYVGKNHHALGDNIHDKNPRYGELTALYWIWKNDKQNEIIGLCHYRRFFIKPSHKGEIIKSLSERKFGSSYNLLAKNFATLLSAVDWILPKPAVLCNSVEEEYVKYHPKEDLALMRQIMTELEPTYLKSFNQFLMGNTQYMYNMFVTSQNRLNQYCEWLFPLLFEFEKRHQINREDLYQQRVMGFLAERLLNVYISHHQIKTMSLPVVLIGSKNNSSPIIWVKFKDGLKTIAFSVMRYIKRE